MKLRELLFLMFISAAALLSGCQKENALTVEERARLMAEEVKPDLKQCAKLRSKLQSGTYSESDLTDHFHEAKKLHCLHGDI